ncbi:hypothetical protein F7018_09390 [Tenacibaculum aiptasiae]|uniref:Uncharacterized protein n=1 Tax=Tenacibaculum aiptasiae TaxID=426481 RepID=A0A7J5ALL4_9FLAO|nr:hypothetical protein [Tenacibaculum aiptasiae]KAB1158380.1 hypothetical protein F7018_09390 [Tenacibaculum aiptasiae]
MSKILAYFPSLFLIIFSFFNSFNLTSQNKILNNNNESSYNRRLSGWSKLLRKKGIITNSDTLLPLIDPNHNRFPYNYLNSNQNFNQSTYDLISSRVISNPTKGTVKLSSSDNFINAYKQLITSIKYQLSTHDKLLLEEEYLMQKKNAEKIVLVYETLFDSISRIKINYANKILAPYKLSINNKLDYIFLYKIGYQWSDSENKKKPFLFHQIVNEENLDSFLPKMPASCSQLLPYIISYIDQYRSIRTTANNLSYNSNLILHSIKNLRYPNKNNGGLITFDPIDGKTYQFSPAFKIGISMAEIKNSLNDKSRIIEININQTKDSPDNNNINNDMNKPTFVPYNNSNNSYSFINSRDNLISIKIEYKGYVFIPVTPLNFIENKQKTKEINSANKSWGWYFESVINQSMNNPKCKNTGFCFISPPPYNSGSLTHSSNFGRITGLLVANPPTITIYYKKNASFSSTIHEPSTIGILKIPFAQINDSYTYTKYSVNSTIDKILFTPSKDIKVKIKSDNSKEIISVPLYSKTANILMISASFPTKH